MFVHKYYEFLCGIQHNIFFYFKYELLVKQKFIKIITEQ